MKFNQENMNAVLDQMLMQGETSDTPVYAIFKQTGFFASNRVVYSGYVSSTNKERLLIAKATYLTTDFEVLDARPLSTVKSLKVSKTLLLNQLLVEVTFMDEGKNPTYKFQVSPVVAGNKFPDQKRNYDALISVLKKYEI